MGKIIPLVSFGSTSQLGSSGDPGGWCVTGILMGCPSHLSWLLLMQRSSGEPSDSPPAVPAPHPSPVTHLASVTWIVLMWFCFVSMSWGVSSCRLYCGRAEKKKYRGELRVTADVLVLCSVLLRRKITLIFQAKPFSTVNVWLRGRSIRYFRGGKTICFKINDKIKEIVKPL